MDQFQCCHLTKAMIPTKYIEHLHLQIVHMVTVVLLLLQVLLSIFSMHTFQLLFSVSLFVVPLRQVLYLLHPFFLYDLSHAERAETTNPSKFLSLTWHFGEQCQRDRPGLSEIMLDYTNLLTTCAAATLVHSFITIRLDYCLSLYSGLPSVRLASQNHVLRSAARLIGQIPKFGHVSSYMLEVLHWLPIRQRREYRVASMVWRCQLGLASTYLIDHCRPVSGSRSSRSLRSSERGLLSVPFARTTIMQSRACFVVTPTVWNSLPPALRLLPRTLSDTFYSQLKTLLFDRAGVRSTSE